VNGGAATKKEEKVKVAVLFINALRLKWYY
jgi:hypothetical protein